MFDVAEAVVVSLCVYRRFYAEKLRDIFFDVVCINVSD